MGESRGKRERKPKAQPSGITAEHKHLDNVTAKTNYLISVPSAVDSSRRLPKSQQLVIGSSSEPRSVISTDSVDEASLMPKRDGEVKAAPSMDAVVKVFCAHTKPNLSQPWQRRKQYSSSSSGFIIEGRRLLTNAHSVEYHTQVKLKKRGSDTKYITTGNGFYIHCHPFL